MAGKNEADIFRQSAMNRIASADELDHYIKVANPSAWAVLIAALLLVGAIITWAVVAIVPVTIETTGFTTDGDTVVCWVDEDTAKKINASGAKARVGNIDAKVTRVSKAPQSSSEVIQILGSDFFTDSINLDDWNYAIVIETDSSIPDADFTIESALGDLHLTPVSIVVMETQPIKLIMDRS